MVDIARFTAQAPRLGNLEPSTDNGAADALASVARVSSHFANRLGDMANKAVVREQKEEAYANEMAVQMPGVEYAFSGTSVATTPAAKGRAPGNAGEIKSYLMQKHGLSDVQAAGIVGNLIQESGLRSTGAVGDAGTAFGVAQWREGRFANLRKFAGARGKDWGDLNTQLDFMMHELATSESAAGRSLRSATTLDQATAAFIGFERPAGWSAANPRGGHGWANRLANAQSVMALAAASNPAITATGSTIDFAHAGGAPGTPPAVGTPAPASPGGVSVTLTGSTGPLRLKKAGTLAGDAYNAAALDIHLNRLDTAMRGQMEAIALQHQNDPAGLAPALDALRAGYVGDLPPQAAALVDQSFQRQKFALEREAVTRFNQELESANLAAFEENISARMSSAYRMAAKAGLDKASEAALAGELGAFDAQVDASPLTPLQKSRLKSEAKDGVFSARILGGFEQAADAGGRAAYLKQFQTEWQSGEGAAGGLDLKTYDKVNGEMMRRVAADETAANKRVTAVEKAIDDQLDFLKKGYPVPDAARAVLKQAVAATGNAELAKSLDFLDGLADWQKAHVAARPEILDAQILAMRARIQKDGATEAALTTLDVMEELRDEMAKGLADDPLVWADRAGVAKVEPLDFGSAPALAATLAERVADAEAIGQHYGVPPKYFTAAESDALKKTFRQTPLALPSLVSGLSSGLGRATPKALAEISKDAPLLAHVAGLQHMTGSQRVSVEVAEMLDRRIQPGYKAALPTDGKLQGAAAEHLGASMIALPGTMAGAMEAATALFEARALSRGVSMDGFSDDGDPARALFQEALDEVLGASVRDGVKYGGVTMVNDMATIAPPDLPADALADMIADLSPDDLLFQGAIGTANGVPIRIDELHEAKLVMTTPGRYRLALGDVTGGDPRYVPSASGGYFELDTAMLKKSQAARLGGVSPVERMFRP